MEHVPPERINNNSETNEVNIFTSFHLSLLKIMQLFYLEQRRN